MQKLSVITTVLCCLSIGAYGQRLDPLQGTSQPVATNNPNIGPQQRQTGIGVVPAQGLGRKTQGLANQTAGYGNQISGYGNTIHGMAGQQGCNTYPPNPYKAACQ
jgi:hypothetical protein